MRIRTALIFLFTTCAAAIPAFAQDASLPAVGSCAGAPRAKPLFSGTMDAVGRRVVTEGMGAISPRWKEHLGLGDIAVSRFRHQMLDSVRAFMNGAEPVGLDPTIVHREIHSEEKMVPIDWPWQAALDGGPLVTA